MLSIQVLVLLMFITSCITYLSAKRIAAYVYVRTVENKEGTKSPYSFSHERNTKGQWGYCINVNGKLMKSNNGSAVVYHDLEALIYEVNLLEKIHGYKLTKIE